MKRGGLLALIFAAACGPIPGPPVPVPPGPSSKPGIVGAYHGPLDGPTNDGLATAPALLLRSAVQTAQQVTDVCASVKGNTKILWLIESTDITVVPTIAACAQACAASWGIELGNEPDLAGVPPVDFGQYIGQATRLVRAAGFNGSIVSGAIYTTSRDALRYLTRADIGNWPAGVKVGLHRYGDPDSGSEGWLTRRAETDGIKAVIGNRIPVFTEFGYPTRTPDDEAWAKASIPKDLSWFGAAGAEWSTYYQITDGPTDSNLDRYGIRTLDGRWKAQASALGIAIAPPPPQTVSFDLVWCRTPFVDNYCDGVPNATFAVEVATDVWKTFQGDGNGYVFATGVPNVPNSRLRIHETTGAWEDTFVAIAPPTLVAVNAKGVHNQWQAVPAHVDPTNIPLLDIAQIRGAMWPQTLGACGNLSIGPRPGQNTNIVATVFITEYTKAEQECIVRDIFKARGYKNVVMGPFVDSDGYHGVWIPNDWRGPNWSKFLDAVQFFWDHDLRPVVFGHPDGWTLDQTKAEFTAMLMEARAQRLIRIFVPSGWEPAGYNWSSCTWAGYFKWGRETLPNALILMHNAVKPDGSPYDAPVGTDELCDDNGKPNGEGWARVTPYLHGFIIQYDLFSGQPTPESNPTLAKNFGGQYVPDGIGAEVHGFRWHFTGQAGWPTNSAFGDRPIMLYYGEGTAYGRFWQGMTEAAGEAWGDWSIKYNADGYLDSGTVAVPRRQ